MPQPPNPCSMILFAFSSKETKSKAHIAVFSSLRHTVQQRTPFKRMAGSMLLYSQMMREDLPAPIKSPAISCSYVPLSGRENQNRLLRLLSISAESHDNAILNARKIEAIWRQDTPLCAADWRTLFSQSFDSSAIGVSELIHMLNKMSFIVRPL